MTRSIFVCCSLSVIFLLSCGSDEGGLTSNPDNITFTSSPQEQIDHNRLFQFTPRATHVSGDNLTLEVTVPDWLNYNEPIKQISGIPGWSRLSHSFNISVMATNGVDTAFQQYNVGIKLGEIICDSSFGPPQNSKYILPYEKGRTFQVNQTYCPETPEWGHYNTFAYDFETPMGTPIIAMRAGKVIASQSHNPDHVFDCQSGGNRLFILHEDGTVGFYAHFMQNAVHVKNGEDVLKGQVVGLSGNSGCSVGPHVHVMIFRDRYNYRRQYSLPFNFSNADGPLNSNRGLIQNASYTAQ